MDAVEQEVLRISLADLRHLLSPWLAHQKTEEKELQTILESLAATKLRSAIQELRQRDPLRNSASFQKHNSAVLVALRVSALASAGTSVFSFETLVTANDELQKSVREEARIRNQRVRDYRKILHRQLPRIHHELVQTAEILQEAGDRMRDFFGTTSGLWDREPGTWQNIHWKDLEEAAAMAREWPEIRELAKKLGRKWSSETAGIEAMPNPPTQEMVIDTQEREQDAGRSEITGLSQGRDLATLPASEIALLSDPDTESLFMKRYAEGTLLNLEYRTRSRQTVPRETSSSAALPPTEPREQGPVIICVDSSGSMVGMPERVAKALSLALIKTCRETGRNCYLIAFSDAIQCIDVSDPAANLDQLLSFMAHSFRGGTDLRPALYKSLELLDTPPWMNSDLLIISDFRVPKLMIKKSHLIDPIRQRHEARLHALSIASHVPVDDLHVFDSHWHFRTGTQGEALGISPDQFKQM